jgi:PAS domain S-box-containing protein
MALQRLEGRESPPPVLARPVAARVVRPLWMVTLALVVVYLISTLIPEDGERSSFWDTWVGNLGYAGCTALCALRAVTEREQRRAWAAIALSLALFTTGAVLWTTTVQFWEEIPYPSPADAFFLVFYPMAYLGVGKLARAVVPRRWGAVWSDSLIAVLGVAALEASVVIGPISAANRGDFATVVTNLAYPIGDLVLVMMVVGVFATLGWRPGRMWWALGAGLVVFAAADSVYVLRVTDGTYETGAWLDSLWLIGGFLIASAAWIVEPRREVAEAQPPIFVPGLFLVTSLGIVLYASWGTLLPLAVGLAASTLLVAFARLAQAHRRLGLLAAQANGLLEAAPEAMVCVRPDGSIALANAQAAALFGYDRDELLGQCVAVLVPEAAALDPSRPSPRERYVMATRRDGSTFPADVSLSAVETPDGVLISGVVRDMTQILAAQAEREQLLAQAERDRLEGMMHQSQRLESLGQLAGGIAHDFNNLLAAIRSYNSFVGKEVALAAVQKDGDRWLAVRDDVAEIDKATKRAARLTQQLLAFARRDVARPQVLDLNQIVREVEVLLRRTIGDHVELETRLDRDLCHVRADPGQIEQVLVNLAVNARDAMPDGGRLTIETATVDVDDASTASIGLAAGRYARLRVIDEGSGMDRATMDHIFEPFFTTKTAGKGTGLGMATVYGIVSQAGGHTTVESEVGAGTTVTALLPATDEPLQEPAARSRPIAAGKGEAILLVEDDRAMREAARRILTAGGYQVVAAANGPEAIEAAGGHDGALALLLTDVNMPVMPGREVAERIKAISPDIEVVFMSGYTAGMVGSTKGVDPGVVLIEKPFDPPVLLETIRRVLDGKAAPPVR